MKLKILLNLYHQTLLTWGLYADDVNKDVLYSNRYGDRCPQSVPAKMFAIAWFLAGHVIFAIFMGFLTSVLTVTVVKVNLGAVGATDDGKVMSAL